MVRLSRAERVRRLARRGRIAAALRQPRQVVEHVRAERRGEGLDHDDRDDHQGEDRDDRSEPPHEERNRTIEHLARTQRAQFGVLHAAGAFARPRRESPAMDLGTIAALWRYPVKSLKAEPLARACVLADGLEGDRVAALLVETPTHPRAGKPYRGKESAKLHLTGDPETAASYAADANVMVTLDRSAPRWFDAGPVSVLFDLWVRDVEALVGEPLDPLRWRPNLFVHAAPGFSRREPALVGTTLRAGTSCCGS